MMFDHLESTEQELIAQVRAACKALAFLRDVDAEDTLPPSPLYTEWARQMNILNTARVHIQMAGEYLHDELNTHQDEMCREWKRLERKKKKNAHTSRRRTAPVLIAQHEQ
jgi:hypothetical protein